LIIHTLPAGPLQTNCYVVVCQATNACAIIDPGGSADEILSFIEAQALHVQYVLLTHAHWDHIGAVAEVVEATGASLAVHPDDASLLAVGGGGLLLGFTILPAPPPDVHLADGQILAVGTLRLRVLHVPGHAAGHVVFYEPTHQVLFDGDVLFAGGIGQTNFPGGNYHQLMDSIQRKLLTLPDETAVYPAHGPATTIGAERQHNPWLRPHGADAPSSSLVPMQVDRPDKRPLFLVHPACGDLFCYADLVRHLGSEQSCYGLRALGLDGDQAPRAQVEATAGQYVELIRTAQPEGPYLLGGWSTGGVVAFEMAQRLHIQGQRVALLALMDSPVPTAGREPEPDGGDDLLERFALERGLPLRPFIPALERLKHLEPEERLATVLEQAQRADVLPSDVGLAQVRRLFRVFRHNVEMVSRYVPRVYAGPLTLFRAAAGSAGSRDDLGWGALADGGLAAHVVPGDHYTMVRTPNVEILAAHLKGYLHTLERIETR
jgi:glyoxylase-like metal-dependent hydrolase (beta-lactamase superfamily II)/thioesterase domain-containing protein